MQKKVLLSAIAIALLAAGCSRKPASNVQNPAPAGQTVQEESLSPQLNGGLMTDSAGPFADWRPYGSPLGKYSIKLPSNWFIEPSTLDASAGLRLVFSNKDTIDPNASGAVVVELIAGNAKTAKEDATAVLQKNMKKGSNGSIEKAVTNGGLQVARVDRIDGKATGPAGYVVETSPTSYILVLPSSSVEDETVRKIVSTISTLK